MRHLYLFPVAAGLLLSSCGSTGSQAQVQMPANTELWVVMDQDMDGAKVKDGDKFSAHMNDNLILEGKTLMPKGSGCKGHVANRQTAENQGSAGSLSLLLDSCSANGHSYDLKTEAQTFGSTPIAQSAGDMARNSEVQAPVRKALENALITKNTVMRFVTQQPVTVSVPAQKS